MKKLLTITLIIISIILSISCTEKKEEPKNDKKNQITTEQKTNIKKSEITKEKTEKSQQTVPQTELGEAPLKDELTETPPTNFSKEALKCKIIVLDDLLIQNFKNITKPLAKDLVEKGKILVVKDDYNRIFFVYNKDGSFASKKLAKYAANQYIGILGTYKNLNGINIIIASIIESMD